MTNFTQYNNNGIQVYSNNNLFQNIDIDIQQYYRLLRDIYSLSNCRMSYVNLPDQYRHFFRSFVDRFNRIFRRQHLEIQQLRQTIQQLEQIVEELRQKNQTLRDNQTISMNVTSSSRHTGSNSNGSRNNGFPNGRQNQPQNNNSNGRILN